MLKVMSFNIRTGSADDGENHWEKRKSLALSRIHAFAPDLLGLQECRDDAQAEFVKRHLPEYDFIGAQRGGEGDTALEMAPLLYRKASFQLIRTGHFWLSETPHVAGSKSWDSVFARTATWVELTHLPSGRPLVCLNTHFDYQPVAVVESARRLRSWICETVKINPLVVTGDFNADKDSVAYQLLRSSGPLADAHRQIRPEGDDEGTYHGFGQLSRATPIDWILISPHFIVADARVDQSRAGDVFPSDHYPITAVLNWITDTGSA